MDSSDLFSATCGVEPWPDHMPRIVAVVSYPTDGPVPGNAGRPPGAARPNPGNQVLRGTVSLLPPIGLYCPRLILRQAEISFAVLPIDLRTHAGLEVNRGLKIARLILCEWHPACPVNSGFRTSRTCQSDSRCPAAFFL